MAGFRILGLSDFSASGLRVLGFRVRRQEV